MHTLQVNVLDSGTLQLDFVEIGNSTSGDSSSPPSPTVSSSTLAHPSSPSSSNTGTVFATQTSDRLPASATSKGPLMRILGPVIGAILSVLGIAMALVWFNRRRRKNTRFMTCAAVQDAISPAYFPTLAPQQDHTHLISRIPGLPTLIRKSGGLVTPLNHKIPSSKTSLRALNSTEGHTGEGNDTSLYDISQRPVSETTRATVGIGSLDGNRLTVVGNRASASGSRTWPSTVTVRQPPLPPLPPPSNVESPLVHEDAGVSLSSNLPTPPASRVELPPPYQVYGV